MERKRGNPHVEREVLLEDAVLLIDEVHPNGGFVLVRELPYNHEAAAKEKKKRSQTRPDQTRPDQTRPDQTRPDVEEGQSSSASHKERERDQRPENLHRTGGRGQSSPQRGLPQRSLSLPVTGNSLCMSA